MMLSMVRHFWIILILCILMEVSNAWLSRYPFMTSHTKLDDFSLFTNRHGRKMFRRYFSANFDDRLDLNLVLIDHYDSFTFNLVNILAQYCVHPPTVIPADSASTWDELLRHQFCVNAESRPIDGIILSPGPGHPSDAMSSLSRDCVRQNCRLPILGVCLGHQILGAVYGARVGFAPEPVHGQVRPIRILSNESFDPLWKNITKHINKEVIEVTRYHSLHVTDLDGTNLIPTAVSDDSDSILMALRHSEYPHFGVQFHPESIGTNETGKTLLKNFVQVCSQLKNNSARSITGTGVETLLPTAAVHSVQSTPESPYLVYIHKVPFLPPNGANMGPIHVMDELLLNEPYSFWLDNARVNKAMCPAVSILGASRRRVEYYGREKDESHRGIFVWNDRNSLVYENRSMNILSYLSEHHRSTTDHVTMVSFEKTVSAPVERRIEENKLSLLPFEFRGGHVGYLGYEVRHDTTRHHYEARWNEFSSGRSAVSNPSVPTAAFLWADKSFVYDHENHEWYLVGVVSANDDKNLMERSDIFNWIRAMSDRLQQGIRPKSTTHEKESGFFSSASSLLFTPKRSRDLYHRNFAQCIEYIRQGESYELCLTNQLESQIRRTSSSTSSLVNLYKILRRRNPAPFSAFLHWDPSRQGLMPSLPQCQVNRVSAFALCCSSPERLASVKRLRSKNIILEDVESDAPPTFQVEAKPIKGTIARILPSNGRKELTAEEQVQDTLLAQRLSDSVKDRAENLMIVDLLRNDLSQVCQTGSVHVAKLMDIETYATVHQMVSTIRGQLHPSKSAVDVLHACFPGGSMTGAPKIRTMELLDELEDGVCRGPYSGCLGYLSLNGCMDMNVVIRTAVVTPHSSGNSTFTPNDGSNHDSWQVSVGAGGAITALSQANDEYDEMMLKASAVIDAVQEWAMIEKTDSFIADNRMNESFVSAH